MTFEIALRLSEILLALALIQQSAEHFVGTAAERILFGSRIGLGVFLLIGLQPALVLWALFVLGVIQLHRYQGPYNGGADKMALLIITCLAIARSAPTDLCRELALAYLATQLVLSYVVSGWVKLINPDWRSGEALRDVFAYSAYPVSTSLRSLSDLPRVMQTASWAVIGLEVMFPLALIHSTTLSLVLFCAAGFHLANACVFGLNRFFWIWLCAYPSLIWFQERLITG